MASTAAEVADPDGAADIVDADAGRLLDDGGTTLGLKPASSSVPAGTQGGGGEAAAGEGLGERSAD